MCRHRIILNAPVFRRFLPGVDKNYKIKFGKIFSMNAEAFLYPGDHVAAALADGKGGSGKNGNKEPFTTERDCMHFALTI